MLHQQPQSNPILFLDVDGVICMGESPSPILLHRLAHVQNESGCEIVVSSTWRKHVRSRRTLTGHLHSVGLDIRDWTGEWGMRPAALRAEPEWVPRAIPRFTDWGRALEIQAWRALNAPDRRYAAVDDTTLALPPPHYVKTDFYEGLTEPVSLMLLKALATEPVRPVGELMGELEWDSAKLKVFSNGRHVWLEP